MRGKQVSDFSLLEKDQIRDIISQTRADRHRNFCSLHRTASGEVRHVEVSVSLIVAGGRELLCSIVADVSERRRAEDALRASEERMRRIIESSPIGIRIAQNGLYAYVNPAFSQMFGYGDGGEILGKRLEALYAAEYVDLIAKRREDRRAGRQVTESYEAKGLRKDGKRFDIVVYVTGIDYQGGPATLAFVIDVGPERELQTQLRQAQKMEAIGTLSGGIAHDFNNILGVMLGFTQLALLTMPEGGKEREYLEDVLKAGNRAREMVLQILAFSRSNEQGRKPVQVSHIVKEALNLLKVSIPSTVEIRGRVSSRNMVLADPTQIHQVLLNLCGNAAHAMSEKGGVLEVNLADVDIGPEVALRHPVLRPGSYIKLTISDTGHGMSGEVMERIFDPYFTTKKPGEGTGLGLAVVHGIVKNHGGVLCVESERGKGSTFDVYLPRYEGVDRDMAPPDDGRPRGLPGGNECILFVDDEESLCYLGRELLGLLGYDVVTRKSGVEALDLFRSNPDKFDLVITDLTMPKLTGLDLADHLVGMRPDIPIILCTGGVPSITPEKARSSGIREIILKPMVIGDLAISIRRALAAR
jgi:PAS domain S-box-containing protein